jgi:hypothetical protein
MKNYYYFESDQKEIKIMLRQLFHNVTSILEGERIIPIVSSIGNKTQNEQLNYEKRLLKKLKKYLTKKQLKEVQKRMKSIDAATSLDIYKLIKTYNIIPDDILQEVYVDILTFVSQPKKEDSDSDMRSQMVMGMFFEYIDEHFHRDEILEYGIMTEAQEQEMTKLRNIFFTSPHVALGDATPLQYIQELHPEYKVEDFEFTTKSPELDEFYEGYQKRFTSEQHDVYAKALKLFQK